MRSRKGILTLLAFFHNFNIHISSTYISNQWTEKYPYFNQEKSDIMVAGSGTTKHIHGDMKRDRRWCCFLNRPG
jgi:hypothetical protein